MNEDFELPSIFSYMGVSSVELVSICKYLEFQSGRVGGRDPISRTKVEMRMTMDGWGA